MQTDAASRMSGADLSEAPTGKAPSESQPSSRIGENPPYGMRGGIEETSASCEARYAPRSYPPVLRPNPPMYDDPLPRGKPLARTGARLLGFDLAVARRRARGERRKQ